MALHVSSAAKAAEHCLPALDCIQALGCFQAVDCLQALGCFQAEHTLAKQLELLPIAAEALDDAGIQLARPWHACL